jgi:hypothetical protein
MQQQHGSIAHFSNCVASMSNTHKATYCDSSLTVASGTGCLVSLPFFSTVVRTCSCEMPSHVLAKLSRSSVQQARLHCRLTRMWHIPLACRHGNLPLLLTEDLGSSIDTSNNNCRPEQQCNKLPSLFDIHIHRPSTYTSTTMFLSSSPECRFLLNLHLPGAHC